ncbi:hypothetical protein ABZS76_01745 [Streptomyces sp. NPDC005562]|uniref:hypothetical protein n=1 Tax=Streptomyces sp. NPDC005562 TaxID=3154890 RepID=UPI0033A44E29
MAEVKIEELLDEVTVRMPSGARLRERGRRRTARRRTALALAAVVALGGAAVVATAAGGDGDRGRDVRPAATPSTNPFLVEGMVRLLPPERMPGHARWRWQGDEEETTENLPLPAVGEATSCPKSYARRTAPDQIQYGTDYYSDRGATARQRVTKYDKGAVAADEVALLNEALTECGLRRHGHGPDAYWSGRTADASWLRVSVERWGRWVSVVEVEAEEGSGTGPGS